MASFDPHFLRGVRAGEPGLEHAVDPGVERRPVRAAPVALAHVTVLVASVQVAPATALRQDLTRTAAVERERVARRPLEDARVGAEPAVIGDAADRAVVTAELGDAVVDLAVWRDAVGVADDDTGQDLRHRGALRQRTGRDAVDLLRDLRAWIDGLGL